MIGQILMLLGAIIALIGTIGVIRFPSSLLRAHAMGVAATLGLLVFMVGVLIEMSHLGAGAKAALIVLFMFLTAPVGSHMLGRTILRQPPNDA